MATKRALTILMGGALGCSLALGTASAQQGGYRPVEGRTSTGNAQGQFPPTENRSTAQRWSSNQALPSPVLPAQPQVPSGTYAPQGYGYSAVPYPQPTPAPQPQYDNRGWSPFGPMDPTNVLDDFFGGRRDTYGPGGYLPPPAPPFSAPVAPVYNPPVPAAPPQPPAYGGYGYTQQPQQGYTAYPAQQNRQQPTPSGNYAAVPATAPQPSQAPAPKAPRPFSNPQESGSSFSPRATSQSGRSDPRFRPPELKGTP